MKIDLTKLILILILLSACTQVNNADTISSEGPEVPDLSAWLTANPNIQAALKIEQDNSPSSSYWYGGTLVEKSYTQWSDAEKQALADAFRRAWIWLYVTQDRSTLGSEEFTMPIRCIDCSSRLASTPTGYPYTPVSEDLGKKVYIAYAAHSLALELGQGGVSWSVASDDAATLHHYFNSRSVVFRSNGSSSFFVGSPGGPGDSRDKYLGDTSPATPIYAYNWLVNNNLLGSTHEQTILAVLDWFRSNAIHFYGNYSISNHNDHWGYPGQVPVHLLMQGTVRNTESQARHWTAGCHGTAGFIQSVLKAVNIPVEIIYTCGHAQLYFPSIDRYMDHGDNPYNSNVSGQPTKNISGILLDSTTYTSRFGVSPDYIAPGTSPQCDFIGQAAADF